MARCTVCGGATTCPARDLEDVVGWEAPTAIDVPLDAFECVDKGGYTARLLPNAPQYEQYKGRTFRYTHATSRHGVLVLVPQEPTKVLWIVGRAQSGRVRAHAPDASFVWVGQCTYAAVAITRPHDWWVIWVNEGATGEVEILDVGGPFPKQSLATEVGEAGDRRPFVVLADPEREPLPGDDELPPAWRTYWWY